MVKTYIHNHDRKISFLFIYLVFGIGLSLLLNLSILLIFIAIHIIFDIVKYRMDEQPYRLAIGKALQEQLLDLMFVSIALLFSVYLSHKTPGVVGLNSIRALEEIRLFTFVKALPRFAIIEHMIKGVVHTAHHIREHTTHIKIPKFGDWEIFYVQIMLYSAILILLAPAFTALTYDNVWHNILVEVSPWHIGQH